MVQSKAPTVAAYLKSLPAEGRKAVGAVRKAVRAHLPAGYAETMQYGMITYVVPLKLYPAGYHTGKGGPLPYTALALQKNHLSVYLMGCYGSKADEAWLKREFKARGKKLDMGKSCLRFKTLEDVPLDVIGAAVARWPVKDYIAKYEKAVKR
jgi:hypothetical protein